VQARLPWKLFSNHAFKSIRSIYVSLRLELNTNAPDLKVSILFLFSFKGSINIHLKYYFLCFLIIASSFQHN